MVGGGERLWLQQEMVARGLARVYSFADNRACATELLAGERDARAQRLGLWDLPPIASSALRTSSACAAGRVVAVGQGAGRLYLNFAEDWRSDFTVSVERKQLPAFADGGIDPHTLAGKRVRARGTLLWRNGPMIEASHPEQLELLPENPAEAM